jgi:hypothetical protein
MEEEDNNNGITDWSINANAVTVANLEGIGLTEEEKNQNREAGFLNFSPSRKKCYRKSW